MYKVLALIGIFCLVGAFAQNSCSRSNVDACTTANSLCLSQSGQEGGNPVEPAPEPVAPPPVEPVKDRCTCTQIYGECLLNLGCDPADTEGGDDNDPGNATNEFRNVLTSCSTYGCGTGGVCSIFVPPVGAPSSATTLVTGIAGFVATAAVAAFV